MLSLIQSRKWAPLASTLESQVVLYFIHHGQKVCLGETEVPVKLEMRFNVIHATLFHCPKGVTVSGEVCTKSLEKVCKSC